MMTPETVTVTVTVTVTITVTVTVTSPGQDMGHESETCCLGHDVARLLTVDKLPLPHKISFRNACSSNILKGIFEELRN
jgi:hypothetical protein